MQTHLLARRRISPTDSAAPNNPNPPCALTPARTCMRTGDGSTSNEVAGLERKLGVLLKAARKRLHFAATARNSRSSRSHLVITITLSVAAQGSSDVASGAAAGAERGELFHVYECIRVEKSTHLCSEMCIFMYVFSLPRHAGPGGLWRTSKLALVDLAGSERVAYSEVEGRRLREATHVNRSLLALGAVFAALEGRADHIPYRCVRRLVGTADVRHISTHVRARAHTHTHTHTLTHTDAHTRTHTGRHG